MTVIGRLLAHPLTRGLHPDDPHATSVRRMPFRSVFSGGGSLAMFAFIQLERR
jgi:hypothetical protein